MQPNRDVELRNFYHTELKKWLRECHNAGGCGGHNPNYLAASLNLNKSIDEIEASKNLRHCLNKVNRKLFGKNGNKKGRKLKVIPVMEKTWKIHFHLLIEIPEGKTFKEIRDLLLWYWRGTRYGAFKNHTKTNADEGWLDYITKFRRQEDEVDFLNIEF